MRSKLKQLRNSDGFTIIEVLIVLVIAASIMLLVFLAVPALQRGSRNNQRKQDASLIQASISEFISNHNGTKPGSITDALEGFPEAKRAYYKTSTATFDFKATGATAYKVGAAPYTANPGDTVVVQMGSKCDPDPTKIGASIAGPSRSFVVLFAVETAGGTTAQCIESGA